MRTILTNLKQQRIVPAQVNIYHSQDKTISHKQDNSNIIDRGLFLNIQGLPYNHMTKVNYLNDLASMNSLLFMSLTETHLSPNILDAEINIRDYNILRQDRKDRTHGKN